VLKENIRREIRNIPADMTARVIANFNVRVATVIKQRGARGPVAAMRLNKCRKDYKKWDTLIYTKEYLTTKCYCHQNCLEIILE
jgi:hypothetical protein